MSTGTNDVPEIGSVWRHNTIKTTYITIVEQSYAKNSTRKIVFKDMSTGDIGGCNSCEWFYSDWILVKK